ncbi:hypothetical protein Efla_001362 [Eimeria flavescens]
MQLVTDWRSCGDAAVCAIPQQICCCLPLGGDRREKMQSEEPFAAQCEQYAEAQGLRELMQSLLRLLLQQQPQDPLQCLIDHLRGQLQLQGQQQQQQELDEPLDQQQQQQQQQQEEEQVGPQLRLILMSLPGSGRREVSRRLADTWKLPLISAGSLLRLHAAQHPGEEAAKAIATKALADDDLVISLVSKHLQHQQQLVLQGRSSGWILDGFPRTRRQAVALLQQRLSPDRCCLLLPAEERAKAALRAAAAAAASNSAAAAEVAAASSTEGPLFRKSSTPATERQARTQIAREAERRLSLAKRHMSGVLDVLGPLAETVPADGGIPAIVKTLQARCGLERGHLLRQSPPKICVIGCRGCGKSTQSRLLSSRYGAVHVDVRELLLQQAQKDEASRQALVELQSGFDFSCDELLGQLVAQRLAAADCARRGWVLEGFPLTEQQAKLLRHHKVTPDIIVCLEVPEVSYDSSLEDSAAAWASREDAARLVEMRAAQLDRWLPAIRAAFPEKLTIICADDSVSVESVAERILEFFRRRYSAYGCLLMASTDKGGCMPVSPQPQEEPAAGLADTSHLEGLRLILLLEAVRVCCLTGYRQQTCWLSAQLERRSDDAGTRDREAVCLCVALVVLSS